MAKGSDTQHVDTCLGVILAGGKSSRMGTDKALLSYQNGTLLQHQYNKMVSVLGSNNVIVSGNYPQFKHIVDDDFGIGPLGGIASIVKKFSWRGGGDSSCYEFVDYFIFLPVDMPKLSEQSLLELLQVAKTDLYHNIWFYNNYEMPLIIKNEQALEAILTDLLLKPKQMRSIRQLIGALKYRAVEYDARYDIQQNEFLNANTESDWKVVINEHTHGF
jgi:molybdopterin-guanine dinucleotide biosynthesis protein A